MKARNIGVPVPTPKKLVADKNCPFTGTVRVRGRQHVGTIISDKMTKTATVEYYRRKLNKKYERYESVRTRLKAHNPPSLNAKIGDVVRVMETRPLSKTKNFAIIEIIKRG